MANYKLSKLAKEDLIRIHEYGTRNFGEVSAEKYFTAFFDRFEEIAERPYSFKDVSYIARGYRSCVSRVDTIYFRIEHDGSDITLKTLRTIVEKSLNGRVTISIDFD